MYFLVFEQLFLLSLVQTVQNIAQGTARLDAPVDTPKLPKEKTKLSIDEFKEKVEKLKIMYEAGMLTDVEFANAKTELLSSI